MHDLSEFTNYEYHGHNGVRLWTAGECEVCKAQTEEPNAMILKITPGVIKLVNGLGITEEQSPCNEVWEEGCDICLAED